MKLIDEGRICYCSVATDDSGPGEGEVKCWQLVAIMLFIYLALHLNSAESGQVTADADWSMFKSALVLQTIHHNHGEGPYFGLLLVESAY